MRQRIEAERAPEEQPAGLTRRPWHMPEFYQMDIEWTEGSKASGTADGKSGGYRS